MKYTKENAAELKELLLQFVPHASVSFSDLGGAERASLLTLISLDERQTWQNGIMENSRHLRFHAGYEGKLESFVISPRSLGKFRKVSVSSVSQIAEKIREFLVKNSLISQ